MTRVTVVLDRDAVATAAARRERRALLSAVAAHSGDEVDVRGLDPELTAVAGPGVRVTVAESALALLWSLRGRRLLHVVGGGHAARIALRAARLYRHPTLLEPIDARILPFPRETRAIVVATDVERDALAPRLPEHLRSRLRTIPTAVDLDLHRPEPRAARATPLVLAVSDLVADDDPFLLVEAFRRLHRGHAARLLVAGDGPLRDDLARRLREAGVDRDVVLLGAVDDAELPRLYREADLFLHASPRAVARTALVEAAASGLPIVAVALSPVARTLAAVGGARLGDDADGLGAALVALVDDAEARDAVADAALAWGRRQDLAASAAAHLELWRS